jgi:hypothetical protein
MQLYFDSLNSMTLEINRRPVAEDLKGVISAAEAISHVSSLFVLLLPAVYEENKPLFNELGFSVASKIRDHSIAKVKLCRPVSQ